MYNNKNEKEFLVLNNYSGKYIIDKIKRWDQYIGNLDLVLKMANRETIISVGIVPFTRIPLALILKNHLIYCAKNCKDVALIRYHARVTCLEEHFPKVVSKVKGVGYLLKNFSFQNYVKRIKDPYRLLFYNTTPLIYQAVVESEIPFIGNNPEKQERVLSKLEFRKLVKELNLPHLNDIQILREDFLNKTFSQIYEIFNSPFVCQRGDLDCGGEVATFFIHNEEDFKIVKEAFKNDERFKIVEINPFIEGNSTSMIGCATKNGTITGPLQTQLIDLKESLRDFKGRGVFVGHDWGLRDWVDGTEEEAERIVKTLGDYLYKNIGYKGIFGVDLIYDKNKKKIFPLECNPRFTGAFPVISLLSFMHGLPPFDFLHLIEHLNIDVNYNINKLDKDYKFKSSFSHILITAEGISKMPIDMPIGIYSYDEESDEITFEREALFPWEIKNDKEFLVIDSVLLKGSEIGKGAFKLFKLVFPVSIAENSFKLKPKFSRIVKAFSDLLYDNIEDLPRAEEDEILANRPLDID